MELCCLCAERLVESGSRQQSSGWAKVRNHENCRQKKDAHRFDRKGGIVREKRLRVTCSRGRRQFHERGFRGESRSPTVVRSPPKLGSQNIPKYLCRIFSISNSFCMGSRNLSTSSCQNWFCGFTCQAVVYSQYEGYQPAVSQSMTPTILSPDARIFKLLKSPWVNASADSIAFCCEMSSLISGI